ncbi:hypothetical protein D0Z07_6267 [Hyphodiscus hymeniophilus]|uniref:Uncharacterized protein n=1 Tax=Hyphodiscus hymeniophilus TaxID=353542 RepID=A0A9P6VFK2_9HELO|nr:hypothetical protein D0Z07_6267 [Hyphodiscus hymeniophilus]
MPPSLDQDTNSTNIPVNVQKPQKSTSAGVQISTKNGRKYGTAKDTAGGVVMAAVTKNQATKMNTKSPAPSLRFQSPDLKAAVSPPNGNSVTSPLLDALSSASMASTTSENTTDWAKNVVPPYSTSPGNLISLGESPPTQVSSYEDRLANFGWNTREQRGIPNGHPASASPPARRPMSYHLDGNYREGIDDHHSQASAYAARRSSMYSTYSHPRYGPQPPLPHQAQAHYYRAPDVNLLMSPPTHGLAPGDKGYFCGFDRLPTAKDSIKPVDNVVVTGYEGGLDILAVTKRGLNKVAKIDGLRGGVYNAKILPWNVGDGDSRLAPLIAVVIHGPVWPGNDLSTRDYAARLSEDVSPAQAESARSAPAAAGRSNHGSDDCMIEYYQTTVEVYSLSTEQHIATLLSVPKIHTPVPVSSPLFTPPPPVGSLTIRADGGNLVIASGTTGETWIFCQSITDSRGKSEKFTCVGKVWTSVQYGFTVDPTGLNGVADGDWHQGDPSTARQQFKASILSLNGRWLAYCPPAPSSQISLRASIPNISSTAKVPGLPSQTPPQLPPVNCLLETPGGESMMKQLAQAATQEMIKGATYLGKQGVSAWNSYWNKPSVTQPANGGSSYQNTASLAHQFPPTHGAPSTQGSTASKDPSMISILDLELLVRHSLATNNSPHPLATFKVPHGCSFISFSPSGLALFTASSKGDVQFVWDLMRIQYTKPSFLKTGPQSTETQGPTVRQIAQFSRMTIARIVDVVWTNPHGERAAMITENRTVHILDLPASAFTWPPPRRKLPSSNTGEETAGTALSAASVASSAVNTLWTAARPLVSRRRRSSTGISAISAASVTSQAGHGTQALAAGISRSVGAATGRMNEMRKSSSNKLHLPRSSNVPSRSCIRLVTGKRNDSVMVVGDGIVGIYTVKSRRADRPADKQKASRGAKYVEWRLPSLPDLKLAPEPVHDLEDLDLHLAEKEQLRHNFNGAQSQTTTSTESSIPQAEIESNAPYQPFHTDNRVGIHVYSDEQILQTSPSVSALFSPTNDEDLSNPIPKATSQWAFGGPIKTESLNVCPSQNTEDSVQSLFDHRALPQSAIERVMRFPGDNEEFEQIVITTRARRSARPSGDTIDADGEGFFEEGMEVLDFASQRV